MDVRGAVTAAKGGQVEFRAEKAGIIHAGIGKASFDEDKLVQNARALADAIQKAKPAGAKGTYVQTCRAQLHHGAGHPARHRQFGRMNKIRRRGLSVRGGGQGARKHPNLSETARIRLDAMGFGPRAGDGVARGS